MQPIKKPERFWIPNLPELCNVLQLPADLFSVKPNELVRKAIDEMTYGMHYYVLFTLIHSATKLQIENFVQNPIKFSYKETPSLNNNKKESGEILFKKNMRLDEFKEVIDKYLNTAATKDFRSLLNHIKFQSENNKEYYTDKSKNTVKALQQCARFFYHRNYLVFKHYPSDNYDLEIINRYKDSAQKIIDMARHFFEKDFFTDLPKIKPYCTEAWQNDVCVNLITAANDHFQNAQNIQKVFKCIFGISNSENNIQDLLSTLNSLKDNHDQETKGLHQFVVYALWTRFGMRLEKKYNSKLDENDDDNGSFIEKKNGNRQFKNLKVARVVRHKIDIENLQNDKFIEPENKFFADPIGVTHLDVLNRAIDISTLVLRRILYDALIEPNKDGLKKTQKEDRNKVFEAVEKLENKKLVQETIDQNKNLHVYKQEDVSINLLNDFITSLQRNKMNNESRLVSDFIYLCPYFADPRFVGEFLVRLKIDNAPMFDSAKNLIKIRDIASHQRNLHCPSILDKQSLQDNVALLIRTITQVANVLGVNEEDMIEMKALNQLKFNLSLYIDWRKRQRSVLKMYDENREENISYREVSKKMIEFLSENKGRLEKVDENDNSQPAIDYILSILKVQVTNINQNDQPCSSIQLKTNNPFDLLNDEIDWE